MRDVVKEIAEHFGYLVAQKAKGSWAVDELEWNVYHLNFFDFNNMSEEEKTEIRNYITACRLIYGN